MKEIETFRNGPCYYDLNMGERIRIDSHSIELIDTIFTGPEGKGAIASDGMIVLNANGARENLVLSSEISNTLRIGAEMIRCYDTQPYRLKRQDECWKLFHAARIFISSWPHLTPLKSYRFPLRLQNWSWSRESNHLTKYSGIYKWGEPTHVGIDIDVPIGSPVISCHAGTVGFVGPYKEEDRDGSGGLGILVIGDDNVVYGYWHLSTTGVTIGKRVRAGQLLGYSGNSGFERHHDWPPHLHFEMWLLTDGVEKFQIIKGRDYDEHLRYLWVPEGGICINPFPYLCEWYDNDWNHPATAHGSRG